MLAEIIAILGVCVGIVAFGYLFGETVPFFKAQHKVWWLMHKHTALKIIMLAFAIHMLFFVPKVMWENQEHCDFVVSNTFDNTTANTTDYTYAYQCADNESETANSFFNVFSWLLRVFWAYMLLMAIFFTLDSLDRMRKRI